MPVPSPENPFCAPELKPTSYIILCQIQDIRSYVEILDPAGIQFWQSER